MVKIFLPWNVFATIAFSPWWGTSVGMKQRATRMIILTIPGVGQACKKEKTRRKKGGEERKEKDEEEEAREPVVMTTPKTVSRREREDHNLTHLPFRSWCPHCVMGRAKSHPHRRTEREEV